MTGVVVAVDEQTARVRVEFPDRDALVSDWLPVGQRKTLGDVDYWLPDEGTQVVCLMDDHCEDGVVLCAIYSEGDPPPVGSKDLFYRRFKDGSIVQYDRAGHQLLADIQGHVLVKATQGVDIDGGPGNPAGTVQGQCICPLIKKPHLMISATVKESL